MQFRAVSLLLAAFALSVEAFAPLSISTRSSFALQASDKPLTELCEITKEACDVVSPLLKGKFCYAYIYMLCVERKKESTVLYCTINMSNNDVGTQHNTTQHNTMWTTRSIL